VAANAATDHVRRTRLRSGPELDAPVGEDGARAIDLVASDEPGPERHGIGERLGRDLERALARLTERQRAAVLLRHQQGLSYPELAVALSVPEGTAKTLVHRGVRLMRESLGEWKDGRDDM
jgi:RNA polymerase sigma-70 factor (ECF subfamily)